MTYRSPLLGADPERVRRALHDLDGGTLLPSLSQQLERALEGSDEATREYVRCFRVLALRVLDEAHHARPDIVVRTEEGELAIVDVKGTARRAPVEALETASASESASVCVMPRGSKICLRMNDRNGSFATSSIAALTRIHP